MFQLSRPNKKLFDLIRLNSDMFRLSPPKFDLIFLDFLALQVVCLTSHKAVSTFQPKIGLFRLSRLFRRAKTFQSLFDLTQIRFKRTLRFVSPCFVPYFISLLSVGPACLLINDVIKTLLKSNNLKSRFFLKKIFENILNWFKIKNIKNTFLPGYFAICICSLVVPAKISTKLAF